MDVSARQQAIEVDPDIRANLEVAAVTAGYRFSNRLVIVSRERRADERRYRNRACPEQPANLHPQILKRSVICSVVERARVRFDTADEVDRRPRVLRRDKWQVHGHANRVRDAVVNFCDGDLRLRAAVVVLASACVVVAGDVVVLVRQGDGAFALARCPRLRLQDASRRILNDSGKRPAHVNRMCERQGMGQRL